MSNTIIYAYTYTYYVFLSSNYSYYYCNSDLMTIGPQ